MECKRTSHANCVHPEGCAFCKEECVGLYCSDACYAEDHIVFMNSLNEMFEVDE